MFCSFVLSDLRDFEESLKQVLARQMFLPTACLVRTVEEMVKGEILTDHTWMYQPMPRGAVMALLREGVSKWRPFISKVFLNLFWVIWDIHFIFAIWGHGSNAFEFFWHPQKWRVSNVSFACRGDAQGVPKRHPFRLRGVVLAPLNACRQGVSTRESRVMCASEFPKIKVFVVQLVSNHLSQKWCYQHRYHHILLCFFGSAKGCRNVAP